MSAVCMLTCEGEVLTLCFHAGPVTAEAIFLNREELLVRPLYYDPIHDFGELPLQIRHSRPCCIAFTPGLNCRCMSTQHLAALA